ncbi:MAG: hypothetical protein BGP14_10305 [Sphingobacteriales bacterium 44-15]|nr:MAG: hypothetical protein BGP14_10305 [Sphingobacteriales bacterium 44-15]
MKRKNKRNPKWGFKEKAFAVFLILLSIFLVYWMWLIIKQYNQRLKDIDNAQQNHSILDKK